MSQLFFELDLENKFRLQRTRLKMEMMKTTCAKL